MSKDLNLYQKLLAITEEIGKIEKTGKNSMQGYSFIEQAKIVAELRPLLKKHGVFIIPESVSRTIERFENKKGTITVHSNVKSRYTVVNADNPEERFVSEWDGGEALDTSDKATNKATTASHKYYLMKLFNISDKEDGDADSPSLTSSKQVRKITFATDKQITWIRNEAAKISGYEHGEDIDNWIESILTIRPEQVPSYKVKDAVDKIKEQKEPQGKDIVITDIPDEINLDNIPY